MNLTKELEIDENTLIIMSADNGGSLAWRELGGVNGDLRCGKVSAQPAAIVVPQLGKLTAADVRTCRGRPTKADTASRSSLAGPARLRPA